MSDPAARPSRDVEASLESFNDKLFEVELRNGILDKPKLIAQDDLIGDAHWAFLK